MTDKPGGPVPSHELVGTKITVPLELEIIKGPTGSGHLMMRTAYSEATIQNETTGEEVGYIGAAPGGCIVAGLAGYTLKAADQMAVWRAIETQLLEKRDIWQEKKELAAEDEKQKKKWEAAQRKKKRSTSKRESSGTSTTSSGDQPG
jgi:hypothetical protein